MHNTLIIMRKHSTADSNTLSFFTADSSNATPLPLAGASVEAGFPSPAEDFSELSIDLNKELLQHPASTFFCRVSGHSMQDIGIDDGDLLVVDKSLEARDGKVAVCFVDGDFTLKKIRLADDGCWLMPANEAFAPIKIDADNDFMVWGIVSYCIKAF